MTFRPLSLIIELRDEKRRCVIELENAFSGKYRVCKLLGTGLNGKVYLVKHKSLGVFRAMKIIPKGNKSCYEEYKQEVLLLKELRFPGIPVIYDMEEAEKNLYIIEDFIQGETLYERVRHTGILSREEMIELGINLCRPIIYLHHQKKPILHLDIHPGNLIIHKDTVSLIDFDHARHRVKGINLASGYGNRAFAAPEQKIKASVDFGTDVYAVAAVMYYAGTAYFPNEHFDLPMSWGRELNTIIRSCLYMDMDVRISDVEELKEKLEALKAKSNTAASRSIAVVSSVKGAGATYIALGLTAFLKDRRIASIYEECNGSGHMQVLLESYVRECDSYGAFRVNDIFIKPQDSRGGEKSGHTASIYVRDYGCDVERAIASKPSLLILVCRGSMWQQRESLPCLQKLQDAGNVKVLYNLCSHQTKIYISEQIGIRNCFRFPYIANIMENRRERNEIFTNLLKDIFAICFTKKSYWERIR